MKDFTLTTTRHWVVNLILFSPVSYQQKASDRQSRETDEMTEGQVTLCLELPNNTEVEVKCPLECRLRDVVTPVLDSHGYSLPLCSLTLVSAAMLDPQMMMATMMIVMMRIRRVVDKCC